MKVGLKVFECVLAVVLTLLTTAAVSGQQRNLCAEERSYDYPTNLKGPYSLIFKVDLEFKYLYLYKKNRRLATLSFVSCGLLHKNLGYVAADFVNSFVFAQSYGAGNPTNIQLIQKSNGKNRLRSGRNTCWIDADERRSLLLFSEDCVPELSDRMILLNVETGKKRYYAFPRFMFEDPEILRRIEISSVRKNSITLKFSGFNGGLALFQSYRF